MNESEVVVAGVEDMNLPAALTTAMQMNAMNAAFGRLKMYKDYYFKAVREMREVARILFDRVRTHDWLLDGRFDGLESDQIYKEVAKHGSFSRSREMCNVSVLLRNSLTALVENCKYDPDNQLPPNVQIAFDYILEDYIPEEGEPVA